MDRSKVRLRAAWALACAALAVTCAAFLGACAQEAQPEEQPQEDAEQMQAADEPAYTAEDLEGMTDDELAQVVGEETSEPTRIAVTVNGTAFPAVLYDTPPGQDLVRLLPMQLSMGELNGNEKFAYLDEALLTDPAPQERVTAGDLMIYGDDCLVLFYQSFETDYEYTPVGYLESTTGLGAAVGSGSVDVTIELA